jgi:8-oxo-dGTP diphosphatase
MRTVVAALICRDSKLLVCQRKREDTHALQWEFPGGKVESGESHEEALARELREELGVTAIIGKEVHRTRHKYNELRDELLLIFFWARISDSAALQNLEFERFEWAGPSSLPRYDFLPADKELIGLLASGSIRLARPGLPLHEGSAAVNHEDLPGDKQ